MGRYRIPDPPKKDLRHEEDTTCASNVAELIQEFRDRAKRWKLPVIRHRTSLLCASLAIKSTIPSWWSRYGNIVIRDDGWMFIWRGGWVEEPPDMHTRWAKSVSFGQLYGSPTARILEPSPRASRGHYVDRNGNSFLRQAAAAHEMLQEVHRTMRERNISFDMETIRPRGVAIDYSQLEMRTIRARSNPQGEFRINVDYMDMLYKRPEPPEPPPPLPDLAELGRILWACDRNHHEGAWKVPSRWRLVRTPHGRCYVRKDGVQASEREGRWAITLPHQNYLYYPDGWNGTTGWVWGGANRAQETLRWVDAHLEYPWVPFTRMEMLLEMRL